MTNSERMRKKVDGWQIAIRDIFLKGMLGALLCVVCGQADALERKTVSNEGNLEVTVSRQDLTRIAVRQDRILRVHSLEGTVELKSELEEGVIFIRPLGCEETPPATGVGESSESAPAFFTLFITTEKHRHVTLHVTPNTQPGDSILISFRPRHCHCAHRRFTPYGQRVALKDPMNHFTAQDNTP